MGTTPTITLTRNYIMKLFANIIENTKTKANIAKQTKIETEAIYAALNRAKEATKQSLINQTQLRDKQQADLTLLDNQIALLVGSRQEQQTLLTETLTTISSLTAKQERLSSENLSVILKEIL